MATETQIQVAQDKLSKHLVEINGWEGSPEDEDVAAEQAKDIVDFLVKEQII